MNIVITWACMVIDNAWLLFLLLFMLGILNSFFPPIPLESITVLGGYLTGTGHGNLAVIWLASSAGMIAGNILLYLLVRSQGEYLLRWRFIKAQLTSKHLDKAKIWFQRYGVRAVYGAKMIPWMNFTVIFCCGLLQIPSRKIYPAFIISNLLLYGALAVIGRYAGEEWQIVLSRGGKMAFWAGIILAALIFIVYCSVAIIKKLSKKVC